MRVLIVEDEFITRRILQRLLTRYGTCDIAVNGREAIDAFTLALEQKEPYDLILLDIMMPELDGHAVLSAIRESEAARGVVGGKDRVSVLFTTALDDAQNFMQAVRGGCEGYLTKPLDPQRLAKLLHSLELIK